MYNLFVSSRLTLSSETTNVGICIYLMGLNPLNDKVRDGDCARGAISGASCKALAAKAAMLSGPLVREARLDGLCPSVAFPLCAVFDPSDRDIKFYVYFASSK